MKVSTGFAASRRAKAARLLETGFLPALRALLAGTPVVHADETFTRAAAKTAFLYVASTQHLTLMHTGDRSAAIVDDAGDVLPHLSGVLVHDGYAGQVINQWIWSSEPGGRCR